MTPDVHDLISAARRVQGMFPLAADFTAGSVGAALRTRSGTIFTGICLDLACGLGSCAERAAILQMLQSRETAVDLIVAVDDSGIVAPCGCCRELLIQINHDNVDTGVIVSEGGVVRLRDLLPDHWLAP